MQNETAKTEAAEAAPDGAALSRALPERFHWLDFLRFLAAMAVVLFHYHLLYLDGLDSILPEDEMVARFPLAIVGFFYDWGQFAVPLFWVLSGFVFAHVYFTNPADGYRFAVARFARLYPLHFATLITVAGLQMASVALTGTQQLIGNNDGYHFVLQLFMVSGWGFEEGQSFNAPIWSVSAEIAAYLVFAMLHRDRWFRTVAGQAACLAVAVTIAAMFPSFGALTTCCAFFFAGSLTYLLAARRRPADFALAGMLALVGTLAVPDLDIWGVPLAPCIAAFAATILTVAWLDILRVPSGRRLGALGDITYSIYLVHTPLTIAALTVMNTIGMPERGFLSSPLALFAYLGCVIAISVPCYRKFERPADRAIRQWAKRLRPAAAPSPARAKIRAA